MFQTKRTCVLSKKLLAIRFLANIFLLLNKEHVFLRNITIFLFYFKWKYKLVSLFACLLEAIAGVYIQILLFLSNVFIYIIYMAESKEIIIKSTLFYWTTYRIYELMSEYIQQTYYILLHRSADCQNHNITYNITAVITETKLLCI